MDLISVIYTSVILFAGLTFFVLIASYLSYKIKGTKKKVAKTHYNKQIQQPRLVTFENNLQHLNYTQLQNFDENIFINYEPNPAYRREYTLPQSKSLNKAPRRRATIINYEIERFQKKQSYSNNKQSINKSALNYYSENSQEKFYSIKTA